jgi:hypothetical protein
MSVVDHSGSADPGPNQAPEHAPDQEEADSFYVRLGPGRFRPTLRTEGAWQPGEQHMAPVSGIIVQALEDFVAARGGDSLQLSRINFEILGMIAAQDFEVVVEVLRPGRTIELLEATMVVGDRPVVRARAWRLIRVDTSAVAGGQPDRLPGADDLPDWAGSSVWQGGYIASVRIRPLSGREPGRTRAWLTTDVQLLEGEPSSDLARYVGLVDTANGIAVRQPPSRWMFPNVDLSIHLFRSPAWGWVGLDTTVIFGADGVGLTSTTLHDRLGPVGRAEQILTVRPLGAPG